MNSPFLTSILAFLGIFVLLVESQVYVSAAGGSSPPPPSLRSPSPPYTPPPPPPPAFPRRPPPPRSPHRSSEGPQFRSIARKRPPPHKQKLNLGKKVGLMFSGIVVILQVGVLAFLAIKRRQILKSPDRY